MYPLVLCRLLKWKVHKNTIAILHSLQWFLLAHARSKFATFFCVRTPKIARATVQINSLIGTIAVNELSLRLGMWRSSNSNSTTFELHAFSPYWKFDECFKRFVDEREFVEKILVLRLISYALTASERRQTSFFLKFILSHKLQCLTYERATQFLPNDVLHGTNMNTDFYWP